MTPVKPRRRLLSEALGDVVATDIVAPVDLPRFTNSAMDGVALPCASTNSATVSNPVRLPFAGTIDAGDVRPDGAAFGGAYFIGTGAPLPVGCDTVLPIERVKVIDGFVELAAPVEAGRNVRQLGEDIRAGAVAIPKGSVLRAQEIGLLAALGIETIDVHQRAAVSILSTGAELSDPDARTRVYDANGPMLAALVQSAGGEVVDTARSVGSLDDLFDHLNDFGGASDFVVSSGGISNSVADTMTELLEVHPRAELWEVRLRPGKHFGFAWFEEYILLALPGNPIAALVGFELFGRPIIERLGAKPKSPMGVTARAAQPIAGTIGRTDAIRGRAWVDQTGQLLAEPTENRGSAVLSSLPDANCLLLLPEKTGSVAPGDLVLVHWLGYQ